MHEQTPLVTDATSVTTRPSRRDRILGLGAALVFALVICGIAIFSPPSGKPFLSASAPSRYTVQLHQQASSSTAPTASSASPSNVILYSPPVDLRYGQVHNYLEEAADPLKFNLPLPDDLVSRYNGTGRSMAVTGYRFDFVRLQPDGSETPVPLYDLYDHHHVLVLWSASGMSNFGASFEYRGIQSGTRAPYRRLVGNPSGWYPLMHLINTKHPTRAFDGRASPLTQCPCSRQYEVDANASTIGGHPISLACHADLVGNPACDLETYTGGLLCCSENNMFLYDTDAECDDANCTHLPVDRVYMKSTIEYEDATPETRPVVDLNCCDLPSHDNSTFANEFDVPACAPGTRPKDCVHAFETTVHIEWPSCVLGLDGECLENRTHVELAYALPHLHEGGLSIELLDAVTGQTIVSASRANGGVVEGTGNEPGNERGYIVGFRESTWGVEDTPIFARGHPMRLRAVYNASVPITGVMARVLLVGHPRVGPRAA